MQVLWHLYPEFRVVRVLLSPHNMTSLFETDVISAVSNSRTTVDELFAQ